MAPQALQRAGPSLGFLDEPPGSNAELTGRDTATPTFTPDVEGEYRGILKYVVGTFDGSDLVFIDADSPIRP